MSELFVMFKHTVFFLYNVDYQPANDLLIVLDEVSESLTVNLVTGLWLIAD